jgi:protein-disulfide isomerase
MAGLLRKAVDAASVLIVAGVLAIGLVRFAFGDSESEDPVAAVAPESAAGVVRWLASTGNWLGSKPAPVELMVFSSYSCGHCADFQETLERLLDRYPQHLSVAVKDFSNPSTLSHNKVALGAECAADQGRFESYHNAAFRNWRLVSYTNGWRMLADTAGIPALSRFEACVASQETKARVLEDYQDGKRLGVSSTPTFFINGQGPVVGAVPFEQMDSLVAGQFRGRSNKGTDPSR